MALPRVAATEQGGHVVKVVPAQEANHSAKITYEQKDKPKIPIVAPGAVQLEVTRK